MPDTATHPHTYDVTVAGQQHRLTAASCEDATTAARRAAGVSPDEPVTIVAVDDERLADMTEPVECYECHAMYDEARGDGYCGQCPACADAAWLADLAAAGEPLP